MALRKQPQPQILDSIGVLIFVDHNVFEAALILFQHLAVLPEYIEHMQQQIAKVARIQRLHPVLIETVKLLSAPIGVGFIVDRIQIARVQPAVLPPVNQPGQLPRRPTLFIQIMLAN